MIFPKSINKTDLLFGAAAFAAVMLSSLAMDRLAIAYPSLAGLAAPVAAQGGYDIVSQNAVAPDARADLPAIATTSCPVSLELLDEGNATLGGTLLAPCLPNQDLVIAHAGMVYSAKTLASGALFFSMPALKDPAKVDIRFGSGETATAEIALPDAKSVQRMAVQWPYVDGFTLHAYENGAGFGDAGHIWIENPATPEPGTAPSGGYLTTLGDPSVEMPLMAQVFTFAASGKTEVMLEAAVTQNTCDQELMGEVLSSVGGAVQKTDVTLAMPDCSAVGEFVQIGDITPNLDLAMAN